MTSVQSQEVPHICGKKGSKLSKMVWTSFKEAYSGRERSGPNYPNDRGVFFVALRDARVTLNEKW